MDWICNILRSDFFWVIFGVLGGTIVGFFLNEGSRSIRDWKERSRLTRALREELETNLYQIEHKKDTLKTMIGALQENKVLGGLSVPCASAVYASHFPTIVKHLKPIERDLVQNVYGRMQLNDQFMTSFEESFKKDLKENIVKDSWAAYIAKLTELLDSYGVAQEVIKSFLEGQPVDVYQRSKFKNGKKPVFGGVATPEVVLAERGA